MVEPAPLDPQSVAVITALSQPRLGPYLAAAKGNKREALRFYQWNIDLSGAVYEALHVFEVFLRNAIDVELSAWNGSQVDRRTGHQHAQDWLLDPARLIERLAGPNIARATNQARTALRAPRHRGRAVGHADIVAQLSFGTWRYLLPDRDPGRQRLWKDALHRAFPNLQHDPRGLVGRVDGAYKLRNRVAHLEPLLRPGVVRAELHGMRSVLRAIDPYLEQWFTSRQRITQILRHHQP